MRSRRKPAPPPQQPEPCPMCGQDGWCWCDGAWSSAAQQGKQ